MNYQIYDLLINPEYFRVEKDKLIEVDFIDFIDFIQLIKISILCKTSNRVYKNNK